MNEIENAINNWIKEAEKQGREFYGHVALEVFGVSTPATRKEAKNVVYRHLYSGNNFITQMNGTVNCAPERWSDMTCYHQLHSTTSENPCKERSSRVGINENQHQGITMSVENWIKEANKLGISVHEYVGSLPEENPCKEIPVRQYRQYIVKVLAEETSGNEAKLYCVPALDERSARVLAFALDGGFKSSVHLEEEESKAALDWTEVIK